MGSRPGVASALLSLGLRAGARWGSLRRHDSARTPLSGTLALPAILPARRLAPGSSYAVYELATAMALATALALAFAE